MVTLFGYLIIAILVSVCVAAWVAGVIFFLVVLGIIPSTAAGVSKKNRRKP